jgi:hypothetical protein
MRCAAAREAASTRTARRPTDNPPRGKGREASHTRSEDAMQTTTGTRAGASVRIDPNG